MLLHFIPIDFRHRNPKILLAISLLTAILVGFIPIGGQLSFQRTFAFFPYFIIGFIWREKKGFERMADIKKKWIAYGIVSVYIVAIIMVPHIPLSMLEQPFDYYKLGSPLMAMSSRIISYLWMLPLTFAILSIMNNWTFLARYGSKSLFFYIYHMYGVGIVRLVLFSHGEVYGMDIVLISFLILMIVLMVLSHCRNLYLPFSIYSNVYEKIQRLKD
jgi:hypothetical protein